MQFSLEHPDEQYSRATYGFDRALGFFVAVVRPGAARIDYDAVSVGYDTRRPLQGALDLLVHHEFIELSTLHAAQLALQHTLPEDMDPPLRRVAEVVLNFKRAAD